MAKVTFASMKLKVDETVNSFDFNGSTIEIKKYLPIEDKNDLVQIALQKAEENGIYNDIKLDMYFNLNIVYLYTNISFTEKQRENESKLYDQMQSNGLIAAVIAHMDADEYQSLLDYMDNIKNDRLQYSTTAGAVIQSIINDLPKNAQMAADIVNNFDATKFQNVKDMIDMAQKSGIGNNVLQMPTKKN